MNFDYSLEPGKKKDNNRELLEKKVVISIITATYNTSDKILQLANSLLNQTYPYFEWIIVNDGTKKEESLKILKEVEKLDNRIKVYHKDNEGPAIARDYGVEKTSKNTEYLVLIDDDDLLDKTYIECSYFSMLTNPKASWCYTDTANFGNENFIWRKSFNSEVMKTENLLVATAMIKKSAYKDVGGYNLKGRGLYEDWVFWLKLIAKGHFPIHLSYNGFWYRKSASNGNHAEAKKRHKENMEIISKYASNVKKQVKAVEFPRANYNWEFITTEVNNLITPTYKKDTKSNLLFIAPWMVLGGSDKFNLDLFKLIDKTKYNVILITTQPTDYIWRQKFEEEVEVVYDLSTFLNRKDWLAFIDYIIKSRNIDLVINSNSVFGYAALPAIKDLNPDIAIMDYIHMEEWYNRNGGYSRDSAAVTAVIDRTLFCNKSSERILIDHFNVPKEKVSTVYIGVDANKFDPTKYNRKQLREKYKVQENDFVISLVARIDLQKRPHLLMEIIKETVETNKIENILFIIGGDGPMLNDIKRTAKNYNLNKYVRFIGRTNTPDEIYAISDATLNCSIKEGLALTAYESLSMGVPVISADVGGQKELINDKTGIIVPCLQDETEIHNFDYEEEEINNYVEGIIKVFTNNAKYKKECRNRILEDFTIEKMAANMQKEFEKLLKKKDTSYNCSNLGKELITQFVQADNKEYSWYCLEYYTKVYGAAQIENYGRKRKLYNKLMSVGQKLKVPAETDLILRIGYDLARHIKRLLIAIISFPILLVKFIVKLFIIEFRRVKKNIVKR